MAHYNTVLFLNSNTKLHLYRHVNLHLHSWCDWCIQHNTSIRRDRRWRTSMWMMFCKSKVNEVWKFKMKNEHRVSLDKVSFVSIFSRNIISYVAGAWWWLTGWWRMKRWAPSAGGGWDDNGMTARWERIRTEHWCSVNPRLACSWHLYLLRSRM